LEIIYSKKKTGKTNTLNMHRMLVVKVRSSPQRREKFAIYIDNAKLPQLELLIDVKTRWNSTFMMIERALTLRQPLHDISTLLPELIVYKLNEDEWETLGVVCKLLEKFSLASQYFTGDQYPTLTAAIPGYNFLLDKLEDAQKTLRGDPSISNAIEAALLKLKQYYVKADADVYPVRKFSGRVTSFLKL
jgi:hypothetical protein